jgi:hypothetical protein
MKPTITISREDILHQVKLSCQIPTVIEGIITRKIIADAAEEAGIKVETEELQKAADKFRLINKVRSADDTWVWLQKYSLSLDDFEELVYTNFIAEKLVQHMFADKIAPYFLNTRWTMLAWLYMKLTWMMKTWLWNYSMQSTKAR